MAVGADLQEGSKDTRIDPQTGEAPEDALAGFLPPNEPKGVGEGFVTYTVRSRRNSPPGTRMSRTSSRSIPAVVTM